MALERKVLTTRPTDTHGHRLTMGLSCTVCCPLEIKLERVDLTTRVREAMLLSAVARLPQVTCARQYDDHDRRSSPGVSGPVALLAGVKLQQH